MDRSPRRSTRALWGLALAALGWMVFFFAAFHALGDPPPGPGYEALIAKKVAWTRGLFVLGLALESAAFSMGLLSLRRAPWRAAGILALSGFWLFFAGRALISSWLLA
ncbi:MAG: hypothetical protein ABIK09_18045 [Pseudomonadota bacterium]